MRKHIFIKMALLLLGVIFISSCADSSDSPSEWVLTGDDNGQAVEISIENEIIIELPSNPSTGYRWEHANLDGHFIYQDGESTFTENDDCSGLVGCGGMERLIFRASTTGNGAISLVYHRSFDEEPADQFKIDVTVR